MTLSYTDYKWLESWFSFLNAKLDLILKTLDQDYKIMSKELDDLAQQLQAMESAEQSAITLLSTLSQQIAQNADNPAAIMSIAKKLQTDAANLAAAVVQYTPTTTTEDPNATSTTQDPNQTTTPAP